MNIPIIWLSYKEDTPNRGYWDMALVEDLFKYNLWRPVNHYTFDHIEANNIKPLNDGVIARNGNGGIIVFPARAQIDCITRLNEDIKRLDWVIIMIIGDEEALFPVHKIKHDNIKIWVMSPRLKHKKYRRLPNGYTPQTKIIKSLPLPDKDKDWFFAGQITHTRREQCVKEMNKVPNGDLVETEGFTQGIEHREYFERMANAKICPCPSGPETPDTFRLYEALEAGCIPIADEQSPKEAFAPGYFDFLFEENPPFPIMRDYESLVGYVQEALCSWKNLSNRTLAWWIKYKRKLAYQLVDDIQELTNVDGDHELDDKVTILIPTSPIPSHPNIDCLEEAVEAVRTHFKHSEIIIMFDGMRDNLNHYEDRYEEYIRRVLHKCNTEWDNVLPLIFDQHEHQASMTKQALKHVKTPTILFVEHDAPPVVDCYFDWKGLISNVINGEANMIRFHHEAKILEPHEHLMFDHEDQDINGVPMRRTMQWSQRPHLASTEFYKNMIDRYFTDDNKTMIEDVVHGSLIEACKNGLMGWYDWRVWIYTPEGDNIKRSYHIDGRKNDPKY